MSGKTPQEGQVEAADEIDEIEEIQDDADGSDAMAGKDDAGGDKSDEHAGDHGEDDAAGQDAGQEGQQGDVTRAQGRGARDYGRLRRQGRELAEENRLLREQLQQATRPAQKSPEQVRAEQEQERQRLELMTPDEKIDYYRQKDRQESDQRFAALQMQLAENADRSAFDALCARDSRIASMRDDVERQLAEVRRGGGNTSREVIAKYLIGDRALKQAPRARQNQQSAADQRLARQAGKPTGSAKGDISRGRSEQLSDREARRKRLENMQI